MSHSTWRGGGGHTFGKDKRSLLGTVRDSTIQLTGSSGIHLHMVFLLDKLRSGELVRYSALHLVEKLTDLLDRGT